MKRSSLLFACGLGCAAVLAACGSDPNLLDNGAPRGADPGPGSQNGATPGNGNGTGAGNGTGTGTGTVPTNSPAGKQYFIDNVHVMLNGACGTCHDTGPGPTWMRRTDAEASYGLIFQLGYVSKTSRLLLKGVHGAAPALTAAQSQTFNTWIDMELKDGGGKAPPNVLEKLGACLDKTKFDAIGLDDMRTIRKRDDNNPNGYRENANNCTGCDRAPCRTCHSGDEGSGFVMAMGNNVLPANYTFEETKRTNPAYLQKYFGVSPTGDPVASNAIKLKAEATALDKAYTHPMYRVDAEREALIKAFVDDAVAKYKAGGCAAP